VQSQLTASATTAGALISTERFLVPEFQREYAWQKDEYIEFWDDLHASLGDDSYFLGLVILTAGEDRMQVVDGQQRLLTITLLAAALRHEAIRHRRRGLADQIESTFLKVLDYDSDAYVERITLSDPSDNSTLQDIVSSDADLSDSQRPGVGISARLLDAYTFLLRKVQEDLAQDPFRRLSLWTQFLTNRLYFAVFVHPDPGAAYRVFEVINTRGRELTTADLLKNYLLSQTPDASRSDHYQRWTHLAAQFATGQSNNFVQFIRHVVSMQSGYILPKDLYDYLAQRRGATQAPSVGDLLIQLETWLPIYLQMIDPTVDGPASPVQLRIFESLNELNVAAVRPLLMATSKLTNGDSAMEHVLRVVTRRAVVGNLGTSGAERRFSDAAAIVSNTADWTRAAAELSALDANRDDFIEQLRKRSFNKSTLQFLRRSLVQRSITPEVNGFLHLVRPRTATDWEGFDEDDVTYWGSTIGNAFLSTSYRRPKDTSTWDGARALLLTTGVDGEWSAQMAEFEEWNTDAVAEMGHQMAKSATDVWY
jgi:hypothetical protein